MRLRHTLLLFVLLGSSFLHATCVITSINFFNQGAEWNTSPVGFAASAVSTCSIVAMQVYIDGRLQFTQYNQDWMATNVVVPLGQHWAAVKAWAGDGTSAVGGPFPFRVEHQRESDCVPQFDPNVKVCQPVNLSDNRGTFGILASATSTGDPVRRMRAFVDSRLVAESFDHNAAQISFAQSAPVGVHGVTVEATTANSSFQNAANVNVTGSTSSCVAPVMSSLSPNAGDNSQFPVFLAAADSGACPITAFRVYVDGRTYYTQYNQALFTGRLTIPQGNHLVVLQAWNNRGSVSKKAITVNVTEPPENVCMPESDPGVTICGTQLIGSGYVSIFVGTPATPTQRHVAVRLYVDNISRAQFENAATPRGIATLKMTPGHHRIVAVAWRQDGLAVTASAEVDVPD